MTSLICDCTTKPDEDVVRDRQAESLTWRKSAMVSSVSRSKSGYPSATLSLQATAFPGVKAFFEATLKSNSVRESVSRVQ